MTERRGDPTADLETTFRRIAEQRMAGVPILNPALAVAALGFRSWQDYWLGVLVTPWFMNLVACPAVADAIPDLSRRVLHLPAGDYEFTAAREEGVGLYLACPLISPMSQFASQAEAVAVAEEVLKQVFLAPEPAPTGAPDPGRRGFLRAFVPKGGSA